MLLFLKNIFSFKCPRCHQGQLFKYKWYNITKTNIMQDKCAVCNQRTHLEPGFYHGTGYISYALTVGFSIATFVIWMMVSGYSIKDKEIFWWLPANIAVLILLQPFFMRFSRVLWLTLFFGQDDDMHTK